MKLNLNIKHFFGGLFIVVMVSIGQNGFAQIDSRNQERPDKKEASSPKKRKKVKKSKKDRKRDKGNKIYSNKKQVKKSKKSFSKGGDKGHKGSITGRKVKKTKTTPRKTYARPQPDPYAGRRIRTDKERAGPPPKKVKTATKKGEVARSGDISGRKRIRQRSVSTNPKPVHAQPNTYRGRKIKTEKDRAYSNKKKIKNVRSVSKPSEIRKPKSTTRVVTATAPHRVKRKKDVYRNHEQRKGEQASTKDIAGKKIRTKNHKSKRPSGGGRAMANPKIRSDKIKSGQRFKGTKYSSTSTRSVSTSGERAGGGKPMANQRNMKNFKSTHAKSVVQPKQPRSYRNRKKGSGEAAIFASYRAKKVRSATKKSESNPGKGKPKAPSISGSRIFSNRKVHTYRGKDRRFSGEHSTNKDIAGRSLRTKNFRSRRPNYSSVGSMNYQSASRSPSNKNHNKHKAKSVSGKSFNNSGRSLTKRNADLAIGAFSGNQKSSKRLQGGGSVGRRWNNNGNALMKKVGTNPSIGSFAGSLKYQKPSKGGGSISKRWNNNGNALMKKVGTNPNIGTFAGNVKYQKPLKGGGSVTRRWNNSGTPLMKKDRGAGTAVATTFQGNVYPRGMNNPNIGSYQGEIKSGKDRTKAYPTQDFIGNVKIVSKKPPQAPGTEYGEIRKIAGIKIGTSAGIMMPSSSKNRTDINVLTSRVKEREKTASDGTKLGKRTTLSFIKIGNPNVGGLVHNQKRLKVNNSLPKNLDKSHRMRLEAAPGTERGTDWALSFWEFGNPSQMGLTRQQTKAKGKLHPSTGYSYSNNNATKEKQKTVSVKLMWAKLFKKNASTPSPDKEFSHKLKYDKEESSIWETEEREDWYNN